MQAIIQTGWFCLLASKHTIFPWKNGLKHWNLPWNDVQRLLLAWPKIMEKKEYFLIQIISPYTTFSWYVWRISQKTPLVKGEMTRKLSELCRLWELGRVDVIFNYNFFKQRVLERFPPGTIKRTRTRKRTALFGA